MSRSLKLATIVLGTILGMSGCRDSSKDFAKNGKVDGYPAVAFVDGKGRHLTISRDIIVDQGCIHAVDTDNDGRFDRINLRYMRKGHPLEKYASLEKLEEVYKRLEEQ